MAKQTMAVLSEHAKHEFKTERSTWVSFLSNRAVTASTKDSATTGWLGKVRDISRGGLSLILRRGFKRGTNLILDMPTNAGELRRLPVHVVHATWEKDGRWILGCEFASPLGQEELHDLLGE